MGILGEIPYDHMLTKLDSVVAHWRAADPAMPVVRRCTSSFPSPGPPGKDGMYRQRSDPDLIEKIYGLAHARGALTILDIQSGRARSTRSFRGSFRFLRAPGRALGHRSRVQHALQPRGAVPGSKIGAMDAKDVNYAIAQLGRS